MAPDGRILSAVRANASYAMNAQLAPTDGYAFNAGKPRLRMNLSRCVYVHRLLAEVG